MFSSLYGVREDNELDREPPAVATLGDHVRGVVLVCAKEQMTDLVAGPVIAMMEYAQPVGIGPWLRSRRHGGRSQTRRVDRFDLP